MEVADLQKIPETEERLKMMRESADSEVKWLWDRAEQAIEEGAYDFNYSITINTHSDYGTTTREMKDFQIASWESDKPITSFL